MKVEVLVAQSRQTLCGPVDCSLPVSSVHGISQTRVLEWVAVSFSRGSNPHLLRLRHWQWILITHTPQHHRKLKRQEKIQNLFASPVAKMLSSMFHKEHLETHEERKSSVQFNSVAQSCPALRDPVNRSTPGLPVHHQLPDSTQPHVH